jgi:superfamily II DNA/RNA helicase
VSTISQSLLYTASESGKTLALSNLISQGDLPYPSLIFTQSIERAEELSAHLKMEGIRVGLVHGKITPARRDEAVEKFRNGDVWVLVVTEVLARGMDFRGVKVVVNYGESSSSANAVSLRDQRRAKRACEIRGERSEPARSEESQASEKGWRRAKRVR